VGVAAASRPTGYASRATAYCSAFPIVNVPKEAWGFHGGQPITGATGSYTRGHGTINLSARTVSGIICQVDRVRNAPDRQIVLSVGHHLVDASHHAVMCGVPGNIMKIDVRVKSTTDPNCPSGLLARRRSSPATTTSTRTASSSPSPPRATPTGIGTQVQTS
jgi:hypothetical protein